MKVASQVGTTALVQFAVASAFQWPEGTHTVQHGVKAAAPLQVRTGLGACEARRWAPENGTWVVSSTEAGTLCVTAIAARAPQSFISSPVPHYGCLVTFEDVLLCSYFCFVYFVFVFFERGRE